MPKKIILAVFLPFLFYSIARAQIITELEATPPVLTEPEARLLITEINFKNSEADWVELYYESPSGRNLNLKGISFADDSAFKIVTDFTIGSGHYVLLTFKNTMADNPPYLYTNRSGLTGTTEQFIIYDRNGKILDAACWTSSSPTTDEIKDVVELYEKKGWISAETSSCIKSETVKNNESIARIGFFDSGSAADWAVTENLTPGAVNKTEESPVTITSNSTATQETPDAGQNETAMPSPLEENFPPADDTIEETSLPDESAISPALAQAEQINSQNPAGKTAKTGSTKTPKTTAKKTKPKTAAKSAKASYKNGDTSDQVILSEIFPNPKGTDTKKEWIEITNNGETDVNMGNWSLDKGESSTKPYIFPDSVIISAGTTILLTIQESKISLVNKDGTVRLVDFEGTMGNEINYDEAPEDQSYSRVIITGEDGTETEEWLWGKTTTPGLPNPRYREISADILTAPRFEEKYFFTAKTSADKPATIYFNEEVVPAPLAKATLLPGAKLKMLLEENEDGTFNLVRYEIVSAPSAEQENNLFTTGIIGSLITAGGSTAYFLRKKIPWPLSKAINK